MHSPIIYTVQATVHGRLDQYRTPERVWKREMSNNQLRLNPLSCLCLAYSELIQLVPNYSASAVPAYLQYWLYRSLLEVIYHQCSLYQSLRGAIYLQYWLYRSLLEVIYHQCSLYRSSREVILHKPDAFLLYDYFTFLISLDFCNLLNSV